MVNWISLAVPFAYLGILIGSLATFASLYRKRKAAPWFPPHLQRNIYLSLLHHEQPSPTSSEKIVPIPDSVLKAALLRRAVEDIHRIIQIKSSKQALATLLQRGSVGDELWQRFLRAEKEIEEELKDVVNEANALAPVRSLLIRKQTILAPLQNHPTHSHPPSLPSSPPPTDLPSSRTQGSPTHPPWGQVIFQSANEIANHSLARKRIDEIQAQGRLDREWYDKRRAQIRGEFMKELDDDENGNNGNTTAASVGAGGGGGDRGDRKASLAAGGTVTSKSSTVGSDEEVVLVEADGGEEASGKGAATGAGAGKGSAGGAGGGGGGKKKKGKK
ncbi:translocation protein S66 [Agyrium rufum]|nr:translocation protein S66 [Agyrium rufum]